MRDCATWIAYNPATDEIESFIKLLEPNNPNVPEHAQLASAEAAAERWATGRGLRALTRHS